LYFLKIIKIKLLIIRNIIECNIILRKIMQYLIRKFYEKLCKYYANITHVALQNITELRTLNYGTLQEFTKHYAN